MRFPINSKKPERVCNLVIDDYGGGLLVGKYLSSMGHENVLCIADNNICMDRDRIEGCMAGLQNGTADFLQIPMEQEARSRFYDIHLCTRIHPALTTVRQSASERAECAIETLKGLKAGNCKGKQKKLSVYLVERCSVKRVTPPEQRLGCCSPPLA